MKKYLSMLIIGLMGTSAWAGEAIFVNNPDTVDTILLNLDQHAGMGEREKGEGDFYGTSLKAWGGGAADVGMVASERGSTDAYGSILLDVNPRLPY